MRALLYAVGFVAELVAVACALAGGSRAFAVLWALLAVVALVGLVTECVRWGLSLGERASRKDGAK